MGRFDLFVQFYLFNGNALLLNSLLSIYKFIPGKSDIILGNPVIFVVIMGIIALIVI